MITRATTYSNQLLINHVQNVLSKEKGIVATHESNSLDAIQTISIKKDVSRRCRTKQVLSASFYKKVIGYRYIVSKKMPSQLYVNYCMRKWPAVDICVAANHHHSKLFMCTTPFLATVSLVSRV